LIVRTHRRTRPETLDLPAQRLDDYLDEQAIPATI
jgi:hypothetical protein